MSVSTSSNSQVQPSQYPQSIDDEDMILHGSVSVQNPLPDNLLICHEWDNTVRWQAGERLHHLFEQRVDQFKLEANHQQLAVDSKNAQWTYQQLDEHANQLARYLLAKGIGAGDVIGLLFDKSEHSYAAMLAIQKINAIYIPFDPAFPEDRIAYICKDAEIKSILTLSQYTPLTRQAISEQITSSPQNPLLVIPLDDATTAIDQQADTRLTIDETGAAINELCYIIYTSGTTGRPKGVPISQANICNFIRVAAEVYGYQSSDRVYQGLTIAFDFAVEEIWVPLVVGATLIPNCTGSSLLGQDLADFLVSNKATAMCCVPTLLATIEEDIADLRLLIVSGEACPQDLITRWHTPNRTILNAYGPTETTVTATLAVSRPNEPVTIGKPLPTYSVIILEPDSETVLPFGEEGEIAVAGVGVADGYLNRDEQTQKVFIKDFLNIKNNLSGLIYRTGDLGLINEKGDIEYRGRIDSQVKIRGYRIELAEIESVLLSIPEVAQAAVDTFEPQAGAKELVAYYTLHSDTDGSPKKLSIDVLTHALREVLPNYMIPAFYEHLPSLPMMASDKVDRKALPTPSGKRMKSTNKTYVAPETEMQTTLSQALSDLLEEDNVSVKDDFFNDLGTSSLMMARYCSKIRQCLPHADISMRDVYTHPNITQLAGYLDNQNTPKFQTQENIHHETRTNRIPSNLQYYGCGALQFASYLGFLLLSIALLFQVAPWVASADGAVELYLHLSAFLAGLFFSWTGLAIATKWLLIGKWKAEAIPIWSIRYYRFWLVKLLLQNNPMMLFKGYPLYNLYLRLLGAKIGRNVVIECHIPPLCSDMITIGDHTIVRNNTILVTYKAIANTLYTGAITLGNHVIVGEGSVIDINTTMEDNSQLGHASCLQEGQTIPKGKRYHGNPAEETTTDFSTPDAHHVSALRQVVFSLGQLLNRFMGIVPLSLMGIFFLVSLGVPESSTITARGVLHILTLSIIGFTVLFFIGFISNTLVPRVLNKLLKVDQPYVLYGFHYVVAKQIQRLGHSTYFTLLFGDSSFIVHYMKWVGYQLRCVIQTGSNFGLEHKHDNPYLCSVGSGTMISDGFTMLNIQESSTTFQLSRTTVGDDNFVGNNVYYPSEGKTGNNCLIATKAMVPVDGSVRENVGLLGSPSFEIPRNPPDRELSTSAIKDQEKQLTRKNKHNLITMALFLASGFLYLFISLLVTYFLIQTQHIDFTLILSATLGFGVFSIAYFIFWERAAYAFRRMTPLHVSIYDPSYWQVERVWKFSETLLRSLWLGTPFRSIIHRLLGIKVGKKLFDDGLYVSEKTLVEIGDYCNFNIHSVLQSHSLEDGIYKSDKIKVGHRCSIECNAFIHYGVTIDHDVVIHADAFVMKGETLSEHSTWGGNPAKKLV